MKNTAMTAHTPATNYPGTAMTMPPVTDITAPLHIDAKAIPETLTCPLYTPGFMRTQLGKLMCVECLIGDKLELRTGYLISVGASYILLGTVDGTKTTYCDLYAIKFVNIITPHGGNDCAMPLNA